MILKNLLFYRVVIFNVLGLCGLFWAYQMEYVNILLVKDEHNFLSGIALFFSFFFGMGLWRSWRTSQWINKSKLGITSLSLQDLRMIRKLPSKSLLLLRGSEWMVTLGLLGNCFAFMIAGLQANNATQLSDNLQSAVFIAFSTTFVGTIFGFWTWINYHMIDSATQALLEDIKE